MDPLGEELCNNRIIMSEPIIEPANPIVPGPPDSEGGMLEITESAARRICALRQQEGDSALMLRVTISGGGCSGFQYGFALEKACGDDDRVFEQSGARVVVDDASLGLLAGARIDFVEDLVGSFFRIENPNASSSCGCGSSFSV